MARSRRSTTAAVPSVRGSWRDRHGRGLRSPVTGPHLPMLRTRIDLFEMTAAGIVEYLRGAWADELADVRFDVAALPPSLHGADGIDRWSVSHEERRIVLYRLPIERLARLHRHDEIHLRMLIESCVLRAVAELLGKDPWDLAPDRFRHF